MLSAVLAIVNPSVRPSCAPTMTATMHSVTDRQTDGRTDGHQDNTDTTTTRRVQYQIIFLSKYRPNVYFQFTGALPTSKFYVLAAAARFLLYNYSCRLQQIALMEFAVNRLQLS